MIVVLCCLSVAVLLPYAVTIPGVIDRKKTFGAIDNHHPRTQIAQLSEVGQRAYAAQANGWEALIIFIAALLAASLAGLMTIEQTSAVVVWLSVGFIVARVFYNLCYLMDWAWWRSIVWTLGIGCCLLIFLAAIVAI